jgi:2-hydroxy-3-keto-5-methylthiopentenyl-1-phosphate phosphatase
MSERNQLIISDIEGTVTIHLDVDATTSDILLNNWTDVIAPT